jgi:hypothetical protein
MTVTKMKLTLTLATIVIGLAIVGCKKEPPAPVTDGSGPSSALTDKLQTPGPENGPASPTTK